jgi:hypothetical protein
MHEIPETDDVPACLHCAILQAFVRWARAHRMRPDGLIELEGTEVINTVGSAFCCFVAEIPAPHRAPAVAEIAAGLAPGVELAAEDIATGQARSPFAMVLGARVDAPRREDLN